jgi:hypothetical protein
MCHTVFKLLLFRIVLASVHSTQLKGASGFTVINIKAVEERFLLLGLILFSSLDTDVF